MLKKAVILNMEIGRKDFTTALYCAIVFGIIGVIGMSAIVGFFVLLIGFVVELIFVYKGLIAIFYKSFFEEDGSLYMTLPLSERDMVLGKIIAATLWAELVSLVQLVFLAAALLTINLHGFDFLYSLVKPYLESGMPPLGIGLVMSLIPLNLTILQVFTYAILCWSMLFGNLAVPLGNRRSLTVLPWIIYFVLGFTINQASILLRNEFSDMGWQPWLADGIFAGAELALAAVFVYFSIGILRKKYRN